MSSSIIKLNWKGSAPGLDPFSALSGEVDQELVSEATCSAASDEEMREAVRQLVGRTALIGRRLIRGAERVLFLWDGVYSVLTIVFTDASMYRDGPLVTRCRFPVLDGLHSEVSAQSHDQWDLMTAQFSQKLREMVADAVAQAKFPPELSVYFSDQDRSSFSPEDFQASRVSPRWRSL